MHAEVFFQNLQRWDYYIEAKRVRKTMLIFKIIPIVQKGDSAMHTILANNSFLVEINAEKAGANVDKDSIQEVIDKCRDYITGSFELTLEATASMSK